MEVEDPEVLIEDIKRWAAVDDRVTAVVLVGSRARNQRVDNYSDLDVELIGPRPLDLAANDEWIAKVGPPMVVLPFDEEDLTTRLVVLPEGRKIDFSIWPETRISGMCETGLNDLYARGYTVLLDKTGLTDALPAASGAACAPPPAPDQTRFTRLESEFWFETTQVAVYLMRRDVWVVKFRENTMHNCLLTMLEWQAQSDPAGRRFTWHIGHHMDQWLSSEDYEIAAKVFSHFDVPDTIRGVRAAMDLFERATAATATNLGLEHRPDLATSARAHFMSLLEERIC